MALGLSYGFTGPVRDNASLSWTGQPASDWNDTLPNGTNAVYCDTDGDGSVTVDDTLAITQNYGLMHNKGTGTNGGPDDPPLYVETISGPAMVGDQLSLPIVFGTDSIPADSIYGLAFTIGYDVNLVKANTASITYSGWLGNFGSDLIGVQKDQFQDGEIDVALTRNDLQNMSGYGAVASLSIVMVDDIAGKLDQTEDLIFEIYDVRIIRADAAEVAFNAQSTSITVIEPNVSIEQPLANLFKLYPQPAQDQVFVEWQGTNEWTVMLYDLQGRLLMTQDIRNNHKAQFSLAGLPSGLYLVRMRSPQGDITKKLKVVR
ncbi:MAG: T9SS type A sorting domain-containing protein [Bacteroidota bacterium]